MARLLPDVDRVLAVYLNSALAAPGSNHIPVNVVTSLPYWRVRRIGGGDVHPRFATAATVDLDCWESTRVKAADLAEEGRVALYDAWRNGVALEGGARIARFDSISDPAELRSSDQPSGVYRYLGTYSLLIRS